MHVYASFGIDTKQEAIKMDIKKIAIHIQQANPSISIIFFEDKPCVVSEAQQNQHDTQGFNKIILNTFRKLREEKISDVVAYSVFTNKKTEVGMVNICPFQFKNRQDSKWYDACSLPENISKQLRMLIALIMWMNSEHFKYKCEILRLCIICDRGQYKKTRPAISDTLHPKEIPAWSSDYCLNPDCLSHRIEKMIDPDYAIPKGAYNKQSIHFKQLIEKCEVHQ